MNKFLLHIIFVFLITFNISAAQNNFTSTGIVNAFRSGDSKALAVYFNPNVELLVLNKRDVYNKIQAELIVRNFFLRNKPIKFDQLHKSGEKNTFYVVGKLRTDNEIFTVYFLVKKNHSKYYIHQLRIEKDK